MKFRELIKAKTKRELKKIYQERKRWNDAGGPFDESSVRTRELNLFEQKILENFYKKI